MKSCVCPFGSFRTSCAFQTLLKRVWFIEIAIVARCSRFEVRGPRSEVRGSRSEVRGSRSEVRGPRSEVPKWFRFGMGIALRISAARAVNGLATQARNYLVPLAEHARQKVQCDVGQIRSYRDLDTWQVGMEVVEHTYRITGLFPRDERFGLWSQMRRASVSIPSNVGESHGRGLARG